MSAGRSYTSQEEDDTDSSSDSGEEEEEMVVEAEEVHEVQEVETEEEEEEMDAVEQLPDIDGGGDAMEPAFLGSLEAAEGSSQVATSSPSMTVSGMSPRWWRTRKTFGLDIHTCTTWRKREEITLPGEQKPRKRPF